ncbi:MAG: hypothetical protein SF182_01580 [Deltaproteobacteria bacterium]|nr:hypothetical protein [Deltaproteobacteria bacterium]
MTQLAPDRLHEGEERAAHIQPPESYNETLRDYLDVEIGRAVLGDPQRTLIEVAAASGLSRSGVFFVERRYLLKLGRAVRELED